MKRDAAPEKPAVPDVGAIDFGHLVRNTPISRDYGFDRGQPIDRLYIEGFLARHAAAIRGRVLEVEDDRYTRKFGRGVTRSDVVHLNEGHAGATLAADLTNAPHLRAASFDCVILTQTLQYVYDLRAALDTLARLLAPGGTLLLSVPGLSRTSDPQWEDRWSGTSRRARWHACWRTSSPRTGPRSKATATSSRRWRSCTDWPSRTSARSGLRLPTAATRSASPRALR